MYVAILLVVWLTEPFVHYVLWVRAAIALLLALVGLVLMSDLCPGERRTNYLISAASALGLGGIILLFYLPHSQMASPVVTASPAFVIGLLVHYSLLRLPLRYALFIGVVASAIAWQMVPMVVGGSESLRTAVFLAFANALGAASLIIVESRERSLFLQKRLAESARQHARDREHVAQQTLLEKDRLIAAISHDLRQPMTATAAHLSVVRHHVDRGDPESAVEQLERAQIAIGAMGGTLDQLVAAARLDAGQAVATITSVELGPLMEYVYTNGVVDAGERGVELRMHVPSRDVLLQTDARSMQRILGNLIANAVKFTARKGAGAVLVAARIRDGRCRFDVIDTGIGISALDAHEIWRPYVQVSQAERDRAGGLGLGLYLVRSLLDRLPGHEISMSSVVGRGTRFTIMVPATVRDSGPQSDSTRASLQTTAGLERLRGARALLLEDDPLAREAIAAMMAQWGVRVTAAAALDELLSACSAEGPPVDAIVCDFRLGMGRLGTDAIAAIRNRLGYAAPAVLITGDADVDTLRQASGAGTTVLSKPFAPAPLAGRLLECLSDRMAPAGT